MREYLYIWHNPDEQYLVASGIEFRDLAGYLGKGLILLEHGSKASSHDDQSGFDYVSLELLPQFMAENIYSWGNFLWADYAGAEFPQLSPQDVAELLYFARAKKPLNKTLINGVGNCFLAAAHDDGWFLRIHYVSWDAVWRLFSRFILVQIASKIERPLREGLDGFWMKDGGFESEEQTFDIDAVLRRRLG